MVKKIMRMLFVLICAVLIFQLAGCGVIIYPERRGQRGGRLDAGVVIMDGLCLFLFLIPGIIAYAVDFSTGTIYLPGTDRGSLDFKDIKQVKFDPQHYTNATIEKIIKEETGYAVKLPQETMKMYRLKSIDDMMARFAEVIPGIVNTRIVLHVE